MNLNRLKKSELKSAIFGMLLGDGGLSLSGKRSINYRLYYAHSEKQSEYALWKKAILDQIGSVETNIYKYEHPIKKHKSIRITTNARRYFTKLAKFFYDNNRKILNKNILNRLGILGLAIWYMDDGSMQRRGTSRRCYLHTQNFNYEENVIIKTWFEDNYGIYPKIQTEKKRNGNIYYLLVFNSENCDKLINLIKNIVIPSMQYKL